VPRGGSSFFTVVLTPSDPNLGFTLAFGDVPGGVEPGFVRTTSTREVLLRVNTDANASPGSYSNIVVYEEIATSSEITETFCQYNLIIE
jgi:hypothetical protein